VQTYSGNKVDAWVAFKSGYSNKWCLKIQHLQSNSAGGKISSVHLSFVNIYRASLS